MSSENIDNKIVQLTFDNEKFEKGIKESTESLDKLKESLEFDGSSEGLEEISSKLDGLTESLTKVSSGVENLSNHFTSILGKAVDEVKTKIVNLGMSMANDMTLGNLTAGFDKYAQATNNLATLKSALPTTDMSIINGQVNELMQYSDATSYSFTQMTSALGMFVNSGQDLETSTEAIKGIGNACAHAGVSVSDASSAFYNLSQAMSSGYLHYSDWKSLELMSFTTTTFRQNLIDAGVAAGTLTKKITKNKKTGEDVVKYYTVKGKKVEVTLSNIGDTLNKDWATANVLMDALDNYSDETSELGQSAYDAASKARTFSEAIDAVKDALSTGWLNSFTYIFGDMEEATELWTNFQDAILGITQPLADLRNGVLLFWNQLGGRDDLINGINDAFTAFGDTIDTVKEQILKVIDPLNEINTIWNKSMTGVSWIDNWLNSTKELEKNSTWLDEIMGNVKPVIEGLNDGSTTTKGKKSAVSKKATQTKEDAEELDKSSESLGESIDAYQAEATRLMEQGIYTSNNPFVQAIIDDQRTSPLQKYLGNILKEITGNFKKGVEEFTAWLTGKNGDDTESRAEKIGNIIAGIGGAIAIAWYYIKGTISFAKSLLKIASPIFDIVLTVASEIGKLLVNIASEMGANDGQIPIFKTIEDFAKSAVDLILPVLTDIKDWFVNFIDKIKNSEKFKALSDSVSNLATSIGNFVSDIPAKIQEWINKVKAWIDNNEELQAVLTDLSNTFNSVKSSIVDFFTDLWNSISWMFEDNFSLESVSNFLAVLKKPFVDFWNWITSGGIFGKKENGEESSVYKFLDSILPKTQDTVTLFDRFKLLISSQFNRLKREISKKVGPVWEWVKNKVYSWLDGILPKTQDTKTLFDRFKLLLSAQFKRLKRNFKLWLDNILPKGEAGATLWDRFKLLLSNTWANIKTWVSDKFAVAKQWLWEKLDAIVPKGEEGDSMATRIFKWLGDIWTKVKAWISEKFAPVKAFILDAWESVKGVFSGDVKFSELWQTIKDKFKEAFPKAAEWLSDLKGKISEIWNSFTTWLNNLLPKDENGNTFIDRAVNWVVGKWDSVKNSKWLENVSQTLGDWKTKIQGYVNLFTGWFSKLIPEDSPIFGIIQKIINFVNKIFGGDDSTESASASGNMAGSFKEKALANGLRIMGECASAAGGVIDIADKSPSDSDEKKVEEKTSIIITIVNAVKNFAAKIAESIKSLWDKIMSIDNLSSFAIAIGAVIGSVLLIVASLKGLQLVEKIKNGITVKKSFSEKFKEMAEALIMIASVIIVLGKIDQGVLDKGGKAVAQIVIVFAGIGILMDKLTGSAFGGNDYGKPFLHMAEGVLVIAASIYVLGKMDQDKLESAVGAIIIISVVVVLLGKMMDSESTIGNSKKGLSSFLQVAIGVLVMAFAVEKLGKMDTGVLAKGIAATVILMAFSVLIIGLSNKHTAYNDSSKSLSGIIAVALGILIMAFAVEKLGTLKRGVLQRGLSSTILLMAFAVLAITLSNNATKSNSGTSIKAMSGLIAIAGAVFILALAVLILGQMSLKALAKGVAAVTLLVGEMAAIMYFIKGVKLSGIGVLIAIAVAVTLLVVPIVLIGMLPTKMMEKGMAAISTYMLMITAVLSASNGLNPKNALSAMGIMLTISFTLLAMAQALTMIQTVNTETIIAFASGLSGIVLAFAALTAVANLSKNPWGTIGIILAISVGLAIMATALAQALASLGGTGLSSKGTGTSTIIAFMSGLVAIVLAFSVLALVANFSFNAAGVIVVVLAMAIGISAMAFALVQAIKMVQDVNALKIAAFLLGISSIVSSFAKVMAQVKGADKLNFETLAGLALVFVGIGIMAVAIGGAMAIAQEVGNVKFLVFMCAGMVSIVKAVAKVIAAFKDVEGLDFTTLAGLSLVFAAIGVMAIGIGTALVIAKDIGNLKILTFMCKGMVSIIGAVAKVIAAFKDVEGLNFTTLAGLSLVFAAIGVMAIGIGTALVIAKDIGNLKILTFMCNGMVSIIGAVAKVIEAFEEVEGLNFTTLAGLSLVFVAIGVMAIGIGTALAIAKDIGNLKILTFMCKGMASIIGAVAKVIAAFKDVEGLNFTTLAGLSLVFAAIGVMAIGIGFATSLIKDVSIIKLLAFILGMKSVVVSTVALAAAVKGIHISSLEGLAIVVAAIGAMAIGLGFAVSLVKDIKITILAAFFIGLKSILQSVIAAVIVVRMVQPAQLTYLAIVIGAVALVALAFAGILHLVKKIKTRTILSFMLGLSAILVAASIAMAIAAMVPISSAVTGTAGLVVFVAAMATTLMGLGEVFKQVDASTFQKGIDIFGYIGEALGEFVGGFIGGAMLKVCESLEDSVEPLEGFVKGLVKISTEAKKIDLSGLLTTLFSMSDIAVTLTGLSFLDSITTFLSEDVLGQDQEGSALVSFAKRINDVADYVGQYVTKLNGITVTNNATKVQELMTDMGNIYDEIIGVSFWDALLNEVFNINPIKRFYDGFAGDTGYSLLDTVEKFISAVDEFEFGGIIKSQAIIAILGQMQGIYDAVTKVTVSDLIFQGTQYDNLVAFCKAVGGDDDNKYTLASAATGFVNGVKDMPTGDGIDDKVSQAIAILTKLETLWQQFSVMSLISAVWQDLSLSNVNKFCQAISGDGTEENKGIVGVLSDYVDTIKKLPIGGIEKAQRVTNILEGLNGIYESLTQQGLLDAIGQWAVELILGKEDKVEEFSEAIAKMAGAASGYVMKVQSIPIFDDQTLLDRSLSVATIMSILAATAKTLPRHGGWAGSIFGETESLDDFATGMGTLAESFTKPGGFISILNDTTGAYDEKSLKKIESIATIMETLAEVSDALPKQGGALDGILGVAPTFSQFIQELNEEEELEDGKKGASVLDSLISTVQELAQGVGGLELDGVEDAVSVLSSLAEIAGKLPKENGLWQKLSGKPESFAKFAADLMGVMTVDTETLKDSEGNTLNYKSTTSKGGSLIEAMNALATHFKDVKFDENAMNKVLRITTVLEKLVDIANKMPKVNGKWNDLNGTVKDFATFAYELLGGEKTGKELQDATDTLKHNGLIDALESYIVTMSELEVGKNYDIDKVNAVTGVLEDLVTLANAMPSIKETHILGDAIVIEETVQSFKSFASELSDSNNGLITALADYCNALSGAELDANYDQSKVENLTGILVDLGVIANYLGNSNTYTTLNDFAGELEELGPKLTGVANGFADVEIVDVAKVTELVSALTALWGAFLIPVGEDPLGERTGGNVFDMIEDLNDALTDENSNVKGNLKNLSSTIATWKSKDKINFDNLNSFASSLTGFMELSNGQFGSFAWVDNLETLGSADFISAGSTMVSLLNSGIDAGDVSSHLISVAIAAGQAVTTDESIKTKLSNAGKYMDQGLAKGIADSEFIVIAQAKYLANQIIATVNTLLGIESPSKVFKEIGEYTDLGFASGISEYANVVSDSAGTMAGDAVTAATDAMGGVSSVLANGVDVNPTITPVLDLSDVNSGLGILGALLTANSGFDVTAGFSAQSAGNIQNGSKDYSSDKIYNEVAVIRGQVGGLSEKIDRIQVVLDTGVMVGQLADGVDKYLGRKAGYYRRNSY